MNKIYRVNRTFTNISLLSFSFFICVQNAKWNNRIEIQFCLIHQGVSNFLRGITRYLALKFAVFCNKTVARLTEEKEVCSLNSWLKFCMRLVCYLYLTLTSSQRSFKCFKSHQQSILSILGTGFESLRSMWSEPVFVLH